MKSITFTLVNRSTNVVMETTTIEADVIYGTDFYTKALNQIMVTSLDGRTQVYSDGVIKTFVKLKMKNVSKAHSDNLRHLLRHIMEHPFNISAVTNVNLGAGEGQAVNKAELHNPELSGFQLMSPGFYNIELEFRF
jgi:hypothetical protein